MSGLVAAAETELLDQRRWVALAVLLTGAFLAPLDFFIVNVAMPAISTGLHAGEDEVQLVISAYSVVYAVCLITGGRLGDIFGRKAVFLGGMAAFAGASTLCGLAWSPDALIAGRVLQALAAAAMAPQALASIHALFPARERGQALSIYAVTLGLSSIVGQLLGGVLVSAAPAWLGWRLIFLVNLPIVVGAFLAAVPLLRDSRAAVRPRLDFGGVVLSGAAIGALVVPLIEGRAQGWPWWTILLLLSVPLWGAAFCWHERRLAATGGDPLVAIEIFRAPGLLRGLAAILTLYALAAFFLTYAIYLQAGLQFSALQAGLGILPFSVGFLTGSLGSPRIGRWCGRAASSVGFTASATGLVLTAAAVFSAPAGEVPLLGLLGPGLVLIGFGMGMGIPTMLRVVVERVDPHRAGLVGGLVNSTLQVSAAMGVAVLGGLFFAVLGGRTDPASIGQAFGVTLLGIAAFHVLGGALAAGLGQRRR